MSTDDRQDQSEEFDGDVLGERPTDDDMPGIDYPPDEPMGVEDPAIVLGDSDIPDDLITREWRHQGEDESAPPEGNLGPTERVTNLEH